MGSIGAVMFHVVGITVLMFIAITIAAVAVPRRPRSTGRMHRLHEHLVQVESGWADNHDRGE
jgi:hypothetical protein